jgi:hypothetical protein
MINTEMLLLGILSFTANALSGILFWWFKRLEREVDQLNREIHSIRLNYLDRFQDLKDHISKGNLEVIERIIKLEAQTKIDER